MSTRIWIVEAQFPNGVWEPCTFGNGKYVSARYFIAHAMKREQQEYLQKYSKHWKENRFRVREYVRKK
jgi:hypothetical protein